jgi:hypothetical protein
MVIFGREKGVTLMPSLALNWRSAGPPTRCQNTEFPGRIKVMRKAGLFAPLWPGQGKHVLGEEAEGLDGLVAGFQ